MRTPEFSNKSILLLGYADSVGQFSSNSVLSQRRATQVHETLLAAAGNTINPALISSRGYSELAPVACNDSEEGRNLNRRVEVWVRE
jgi:phosphate transport system substrate-binding protein